ncbi:MAG: MFS transporter [Marinilabiliales bacterium]|nr:MAG: MFS transporter [Marinilabiliales bacterium]
MNSSTISKTSKYATLPIFFAFLCMGFGDVVGPMVSLAKNTFSLSNIMAQLLPLSGFIMFGLLSIPIGVYQDKKGKKFILILGLIIAFIGLIIPVFNGMYGPAIEITASDANKYYIVLISILMLGAGATILQVAGNPIMRDVSAEGRYSSNLSLAQSIKAIGSSMGFLLPPFVVAAFGLDWSILFPIYAILILITLIWVNSVKINERDKEKSKPATIKSCFKLLGNGYVISMVLGIFLYVGAEVSMSSGVPILLTEMYGIKDLELLVAWLLFFMPILIGRFTGSAILRVIKPRNFLILTVFIAIIGILLIFVQNITLAYIGIVMVGLGFANIFPLIFSITVDRMPERSNELSGLMVTAIVGGALIPVVWGAVADNFSVLWAFAVPLICILYIAVISFRKSLKTA